MATTINDTSDRGLRLRTQLLMLGTIALASLAGFFPTVPAALIAKQEEKNDDRVSSIQHAVLACPSVSANYSSQRIEGAVEANLVNVRTPTGGPITPPFIPLFWHVPKSGGTTMKHFIQCMDFIMVNRNHGRSSTSLDILADKKGKNRYMNVDISTKEGILGANRLGFLDYYHADEVLVSSILPVAAKSLFQPNNPGAVFALLRHPVERAVSRFYYLQHATWEKGYAPELANTTILEHFQSGQKIYNNWMVCTMVGKSRVTRDDLDDAKYLLERKVVIGLTDHMAESLQRFERYFGWADTKKTFWPECFAKFANKEGSKNSFNHPIVEPGSPEWDAIVQHNALDIELYEHAVDLFHCRDH